MARAGEASVEAYSRRTRTGHNMYVRAQVRDLTAGSVPAPTAVLFGWFGAAPKHVGKYAQQWEALGYSTVVVTAPTSVLFWLSQSNVPEFVLSVLIVVAEDARLSAGGLIVQFFSNGGAFCAPALSSMFDGESRNKVSAAEEAALRCAQDSLSGVVFDSAPAFLHYDTPASAFINGSGVKEGSWTGFLLRWVFIAIFCIQRMFFNDMSAAFWNGMRNADYGCPELYMFSKADRITDAERIAALVRERTGRFKERVHEFCVNDAPHVKLMVKYPEEYARQLEQVNQWGVNAWRKNRDLPEWKPCKHVRRALQ